MRRILFFITEDWFFLSHFWERAIGAQEAGFDVAVVAHGTGCESQIRAAGLRFIPIDIERAGTNLLREVKTLFHIWHIYRRESPDVVHHIAMKPIIYGTIASLVSGVPAIINAPVGLGFVFTADTLRARLMRLLLLPLLRFLLNPARSKVVFENKDDLKSFVDNGAVRASDAVLIQGAGVDVKQFQMLPEPGCSSVIITLTARMLRDKGIYEFVEAAALVKKQGISARFLLVGSPDPANPSSIPEATLQDWARKGDVEVLGHRTDIAEILTASHIVCLPSYREGLPKSLLEALSCGRPVVTTNVPGCRQTVRHEHNGLLVPPRDPAALTLALLRLIQNADERKRFGANGRKMAETLFSSTLIVGSTIRLYESIAPR